LAKIGSENPSGLARVEAISHLSRAPAAHGRLRLRGKSSQAAISSKRRVSMPAKCRVGVCGFDPMLVRGYCKTGFRALWWHIPDELYEEFNVKPNGHISGKLLKVYIGKTGKMTHEPNEAFHWNFSKESGLAVLLPAETIMKYELTEFHFIEVLIEKINDQPVWAGAEKDSTKMWPMDKMKLGYTADYIAP
jgi:hypothetical protein